MPCVILHVFLSCISSTPAIFEGPALPPITSSHKRKYEDEEEYDSEMDDFIDDEGEEQDEISKHIREIFGYDKTKWVFAQFKVTIKYPWSWKDFSSYRYLHRMFLALKYKDCLPTC